MVQRHKMTADFEQLTYNGDMLKDSWKNQLVNFQAFNSNGIVDSGMMDFINWVIQNNICNKFFVGSSMYSLLISKPIKGKLNYQQTLSIEFDKKSELYSMKYSDWNFIDNREDYKNAVLWKSKCSNVELPAKFLEFIDWNKDWNIT